MRRIKTLIPGTGETLYTWDSMACERPTPPRWTHNGELLDWVFVGYEPHAAFSNFKTYFFEAIGSYKSDKECTMIDVRQATARGDHKESRAFYKIAQSMEGE